MSEPRVITIKIRVCEPCLRAEGSECHTPGCALYLHRTDIPIAPEMYEIVEDVDGPPVVEEAIADLRKAMACLYLEVPESIADDVRDKGERLIEQLKKFHGLSPEIKTP